MFYSVLFCQTLILARRLGAFALGYWKQTWVMEQDAGPEKREQVHLRMAQKKQDDRFGVA